MLDAFCRIERFRVGLVEDRNADADVATLFGHRRRLAFVQCRPEGVSEKSTSLTDGNS